MDLFEQAKNQLIIASLFAQMQTLSDAVESVDRNDPRHASIYLRYMLLELELKEIVKAIGNYERN
jgi:hypothetical protein